jgi:hypothetical protein
MGGREEYLGLIIKIDKDNVRNTLFNLSLARFHFGGLVFCGKRHFLSYFVTIFSKKVRHFSNKYFRCAHV